MKQKKTKDYTLLLIAIILIVCALCSCNFKSNPDRHFASDISNIKTQCRYEGRECPNYSTCEGHYNELRDYQIDLHNDTVWVYDGNRLVGRYTSNWDNQIDTILLNDNQ